MRWTNKASNDKVLVISNLAFWFKIQTDHLKAPGILNHTDVRELFVVRCGLAEGRHRRAWWCAALRFVLAVSRAVEADVAA